VSACSLSKMTLRIQPWFVGYPTGKFKGLFRLVQRGVYYAARCLIPCSNRAITVPPAKFTHSLCKFGTKQGLWDPLKIPDVCEETHLDPYEFIYARYEFDPTTQRTNAAMIQLYKKWPRLQVTICNVYSPWCLLFCLCD
jgi:hypothetical protein